MQITIGSLFYPICVPTDSKGKPDPDNSFVRVELFDDAAHLPVTESVVAIRDIGDQLNWIEGKHRGGQFWDFSIPSGYSKFKFGVKVSETEFLEDPGLNNPSHKKIEECEWV